MQIGNWFEKGRRRIGTGAPGQRLNKGPRRKQQRLDRKLRVESLEDRRMLATFVVNSPFDTDGDGNALPGTLRNAVQLANASETSDTIIFSENLLPNGVFIFLNGGDGGGELVISEPLRILGPGPGKVSISAAPASRIFNVNVREEDAAFPVTISGVTLSGGSVLGTDDEDVGGAIANLENLRINEVIFEDNSATGGGGAIYNGFGSTTIDRSLFVGNSGALGGAILNGPDADTVEGPLSVTIRNSTLSGNTAGDGGGIYNRIGTVNVLYSTIRENSGYYAGGIASRGNPVPEEDGAEPPPPVVFTYLGHSIVEANTLQMELSDVDTLGMTEGDEPVPLLPSIMSEGYNIIGIPGANLTLDAATDMIDVDPILLPLDDYGGSTPVYYPQSDPLLGLLSPAIDAGNIDAFPPFAAGEFLGPFEQRGRHFSRVAQGLATSTDAIVDIGAVEVQAGVFIVDSLEDEADGQYSLVVDIISENSPTQTGQTGYFLPGDFALREAIEFSEKNPEIDTIQFAADLLDEDDPTNSEPPTILLTQLDDLSSALIVTKSVNIEGPEGFELEVDATGLDATPNQNNADGGRIFRIDNGDSFSAIDVTISSLTLMGGDVTAIGGAIYNRENLTITGSTVKDNYSSADGGGIYTQFGNLTVESTILHDNFAASDGGAIFLDTAVGTDIATATVRNSTVSGNLAGSRGGGIYNKNGEVLVEFSTVTKNAAPPAKGGGIANLPGVNALTQIRSSIVSDNSGNDISMLQGAVNVQSLGFNLIGTGNATIVFNQPGDHTGVTNPGLAPLAITGGLRPTHRVLPDSPAIDAGDPTAIANTSGVPEFDQRGTPFGRVFDGVQDTKDRIDIGAYELQPATFIVDSPFDENDGDTSIGNLSLREAIEISNINPLTDTITFSPSLLDVTLSPGAGVLQPGTPIDFLITDSVNIIGLGESGITIQGLQAVDEFGNFVRLFTIDDGNPLSEIVVSITDLSILNYPNTNDVGGAIKNFEDLTLERVSLINNTTLGDGYHGGAIYHRYGHLTLDSVTLTSNSTDGINADGGAIYVLDGDLTVVNNSSISGNSTSQTQGNGGGIYIRGGTLNIANYTYISGNAAPAGQADGAGIFGYQAILNISDSTISGNSMSGSNSEGAGIHIRDSQLTLTDSLLSFNSTTGTLSEGGGLYINGGSADIDNVVFFQNFTAGGSSVGGAVANVGGDVTITRSTLDGNTTSGTSASGGAVHNLGGNLSITDSTISNNAVSGPSATGGGVFSDTNLAGTSSTLIRNSTISGNSTANRGGGIYNADGLTRIEYSTITDNEREGQIFALGGGVGSYGSNTTRTEVRSSIISGNRGSDVDILGGPGFNSFVSEGFNVVGNGVAIGAFSVGAGDQPGVLDPML
ncbi:hypothetical protein OAS39_11705, partial [Pirellulales bacterium]|nr:hypothetical protein [Pirellulales bacterium]